MWGLQFGGAILTARGTPRQTIFAKAAHWCFQHILFLRIIYIGFSETFLFPHICYPAKSALSDNWTTDAIAISSQLPSCPTLHEDMKSTYRHRKCELGKYFCIILI